MSIRFDGKVAIVTGAGAGLGRCHALGLAARGAKVMINDIAAVGEVSAAAAAVVAEIEAAGGEAIAHGANVADAAQVEDMVAQTMAKWGRVDILINNAGILRDKSFAKMTMDDFRLVVDVHLMGAAYCSKAVWNIMREQGYGRIVMTTSSSGLYGNFGQANYGAGKMAVVGLMNTLSIEGHKNNIRVNALSPTAATSMTEGLISEEVFALITPESVTPAALFLCSDEAPTKTIVGAGAGSYAVARLYETDGMYLPEEHQNPEGIAEHWQQLFDNSEQKELSSGWGQTAKFVEKSAAGQGIAIDLSNV
ncbi:Putative short-chain type dehydrogenase/reductase [Sinobacterium norvegicum]|uniref:Short-chain type dehydrogenase/reductase n=1 Tax=Sinobacterium norvegicum TaxID=1641715 RepID=A0ABM9AG01_9GAMM|nr:SDR family NAD(P)-dependent oxidoreductase [Sinobacterium norvegicum]CAH0992140.1 Putative short-chain type dehydrogenase/reductase [Sinobacterium norvegicum]